MLTNTASALPQQPGLTTAHGDAGHGAGTAALMVGALGVVFGDIGTSPLYTLRECFSPAHGILPSPENVLGILSLIFWALILVVTLKYVVVVMRADNKGEGGDLALLALTRRLPGSARRHRMLMIVGLLGASLFYGDSIITPAISVLSAVEGIGVNDPTFRPYVVPCCLVVLALLFFVQRHGTERVGTLFGPIMGAWFATLAGLGIVQIVSAPQVLMALDPRHAVDFFLNNGLMAFLVLGAVVLAVTGGEALYTDMGHFGRHPIRMAWFTLVLPALLLNYFGQGALLLADPDAVESPFYRMVPDWGHFPMVALATAATVIASQAVISGAFSVTQQAIQLGFLPRLRILHTSATTRGQIYIPPVNWALMIGVVLLVVLFGSSSRLAAAYGIAVTGTMLTTTILVQFVAREMWGWSALKTYTVTGLFFCVDLAFFSANAIKIPDGGWFPLMVGAGLFLVMTTWRRGRELATDQANALDLKLDSFIARLPSSSLPRVAGTAVFMSALQDAVPRALLHNIKHNKVLHERVVVLTVIVEDRPRVAAAQRLEMTDAGNGFTRVFLRYGFMEEPDIPGATAIMAAAGLPLDCMRTSFFIGRDTIVPSDQPGMALWREHLFAYMARNAASPTDFFRIPPNRVVELGSQVEI